MTYWTKNTQGKNKVNLTVSPPTTLQKMSITTLSKVTVKCCCVTLSFCCPSPLIAGLTKGALQSFPGNVMFSVEWERRAADKDLRENNKQYLKHGLWEKDCASMVILPLKSYKMSDKQPSRQFVFAVSTTESPMRNTGEAGTMAFTRQLKTSSMVLNIVDSQTHIWQPLVKTVSKALWNMDLFLAFSVLLF